MDPNTLSMEQGKQFLKQCGIPQYDIDMMTEKWVVVASVEVLLRFPLTPGEDPAARCVSNKKCQPSSEQPHTTSQRLGDQKERKSNSRPTSRADQKPKHVEQTLGFYTHQQAQGPPENKVLKKQLRRPAGHKVLPPEQERNTVKCKNCGGFGHTVRSKRCPIKGWAGIIPLQPLGANKEKENRKPRKPQQLQIPGLVSKMDREKKPSVRQEELQREAAPPGLPSISYKKVSRSCRESVESCAFLRKPTRPMPIQATKNRSALSPVPKGAATIKSPDVRSFCPTQSDNRRPEWSICAPNKVHQVNHPDFWNSASKSFSQDPILSSTSTANWSVVYPGNDLQPARKTPTLGHARDPLAHIKCPHVDSKHRPWHIRQKWRQDSKVRIPAPGKSSAQVPDPTHSNKGRLSISPPSQRGALIRSSILHSKIGCRNIQSDQGTAQLHQLPANTSELGTREAHKMTTRAPGSKSSVQPQLPPNLSCLSLPQDCAVFQHPPSNQAPGKPEETSFMRWQNCRLQTAPTSNLTVKCTLMDQRPHTLNQGHVPSVLYEDLVVSSSSGDSDWE